MNKTVRLFKAVWQGQELSREAVVKVLGQVLEPVGVVQGDLAVFAEMFESRGVRANGGEKVLGTGGGMYVPLLMKNLANSDECRRRHSGWRCGVEWSLWGQRSWGLARGFSFGTAQQGTSLLECPC